MKTLSQDTNYTVFQLDNGSYLVRVKLSDDCSVEQTFIDYEKIEPWIDAVLA